MEQDLINRRFGRLTVIHQVPFVKDKRWLCRCDCGNLTSVLGYNLLNGNTKSCGCLRKDGMTIHGLSYSRLYKIWKGMKRRCYDSKRKEYCWYGEKGIRICPEWLVDPSVFYEWALANGYQPNLTIDRINSDGDYEPSNCRWATAAVQRSNQK